MDGHFPFTCLRAVSVGPRALFDFNERWPESSAERKVFGFLQKLPKGSLDNTRFSAGPRKGSGSSQAMLDLASQLRAQGSHLNSDIPDSLAARASRHKRHQRT